MGVLWVSLYLSLFLFPFFCFFLLLWTLAGRWMVERNIKFGLLLLFCYCMHDRTVFGRKKEKRVTYGLNGLLDNDRHTHINSEWRSAMCSFGLVCGVVWSEGDNVVHHLVYGSITHWESFFFFSERKCLFDCLIWPMQQHQDQVHQTVSERKNRFVSFSSDHNHHHHLVESPWEKYLQDYFQKECW